MPRRKVKLKVISSAPCSQLWTEMQGTQRERHCEVCDKHVHNFAAMTASEIEQLVHEREGRLCARVTYSPDGSIRTMDGLTQPSVAAGIVLAASLAFGASSAAETSEPPAKATLTGTVLNEDGSAPLAGAVVGLRSGHQPIAITNTDTHGDFLISAEPGQSDILIGRNVFFGVHIYAADLHAGEQSLQPIRFSADAGRPTTDYVTMGDVVSSYRYPISYLFKHPLRYLKHLPHNF